MEHRTKDAVNFLTAAGSIESYYYSTMHLDDISADFDEKKFLNVLASLDGDRISAITLWISAICSVKSLDSHTIQQKLPFMEINIAINQSRKVIFTFNSNISSLFSADNAEKMLLISLLTDEHFSSQAVPTTNATDWPAIRTATEPPGLAFNYANNHLGYFYVNGDIFFYKNCSFITNDLGFTSSNDALSIANKKLGRLHESLMKYIPF